MGCIGAPLLFAIAMNKPNTFELMKRNPRRVVLIGAVIVAFSALFAYTGGLFTPHRLSADRFIGAMEHGSAPTGFRRAHSKGICIAGSFVGSAEGRALSSATVFLGDAVAVTGRFAEAEGNPFANDATTVPVRSMALRLLPTTGGEWRMAINDIPGLAVSTPEAFYENVLASTPDPKTGKPDPAKMSAYLAAHPETVAFNVRLKARPLASGFSNDTYNSVNGFIFVAPDGTRRLVRWSMQAEEPFATLSPDERAARSANYLFDDLLGRIARGPVKWRLIATLAAPGDPNEAAKVWPEDRPHVTLGELTINHVESESAGNCRDLNFDPLTLPSGISPSDDPIPFARSAIYSASFRRRMGELKPPSAIANQSAGAKP
jgi:catalase